MKKITTYIILVFCLLLTACSNKENKIQPSATESTQCNVCLNLSKCITDYAEPRLLLYSDSNQLAQIVGEVCQGEVIELKNLIIKIAIQNNASKDQLEEVKKNFDEQINSFLIKKNIDDLRSLKSSDIH